MSVSTMVVAALWSFGLARMHAEKRHPVYFGQLSS